MWPEVHFKLQIGISSASNTFLKPLPQAEQVFEPLQQIMVIVQVVWISQSIVLHPTVSQAGSCPNTTFQPPPGTYYYIIHTQSDIPITSGEKTHILWKRGHAEKFG